LLPGIAGDHGSLLCRSATPGSKIIPAKADLQRRNGIADNVIPEAAVLKYEIFQRGNKKRRDKCTSLLLIR
jgi:hypothetical protein